MSTNEQTSPNFCPQFEWKADLNIPGVDLEAIREKYTKMARERDERLIGTNPELMKNEKLLKQVQAAKDKSKLSVPKGASDANQATTKALNAPMPKVDNLLICNACQGIGIRKISYMYQVRDTNCDECDGSGLIEKVKSNPNGLSDAELWEVRKTKVRDVEVAQGQEESRTQKEILGIVRQKFGSDQQKTSQFFRETREYGSYTRGGGHPPQASEGALQGAASAHHKYYAFLMQHFNKLELRDFLPKLARLIKDDDKRLSLLATPLTAEMEDGDSDAGSSKSAVGGSGSIFTSANHFEHLAEGENPNPNAAMNSDGGYVNDPYSGAPMRVTRSVMAPTDDCPSLTF
jgi:hypothetical protein